MEKFNYKKPHPRLTVKYFNSATEEFLFEDKNRNATNVGDFLSDGIVTSLIETRITEGHMKKLPKKITALVSAEFDLIYK